MIKKYNIAVVGATGNVGSNVLEILAERSFPIAEINAVASRSSVGKSVSYGEKLLKISTLDSIDFNKIDIAFFAAGSTIAKQYIPKIANNGCIVIDKSSYFRLNPDVPLIVPEANPIDLKNYSKRNIIANPNCCTIPLTVILKPLDNEYKINRVVASTYQSTSGAGKAAMDELYSQTKAKYVFQDRQPNVFKKQIAFNLFPHIGDFNTDGSTSEESKIESEVRKIMGAQLQISVTCVRVPVFLGHSISVNIEFSDNININEITEILSQADGVKVLSANTGEQYITPVEVAGLDAVYVSRIRSDNSRMNSINLWITVDNLRKGAALNAVQIAEELTRYI
ncbi:Aspartate-semialdehyde dehydrogenase 2 [Candidatus Trichorickettsia mobilis]|uniref:Aspartate-semialdehyde dehydrogenase n=1 Tax=Candidatus Trichorickettsia mobilis TaxID=1346319 RepID=A0ABZ0USD9_9RICK|nr:aspartate-semialdehyde dehydrogenase [Candidatus Trichorickettsia mobilis]WPY00568.1 Aspartate-semialdehyde dehydrogenase 2 [Candidatus Trichorickettsia mobilis]